MSRSRIWSVLIAAALIGAPTVASAQVTVGPVLAYDSDIEFGLGASVGTALPSLGEGFGLLADFIYFFPPGDGFDYFELNGNVTYDFPLENSSVVPFLLGGLNLARASVDLGALGSGSNTELGLNLGGGIDFDLGNFRPTAGLRAEINGGEATVIFISLPFQTGGN